MYSKDNVAVDLSVSSYLKETNTFKWVYMSFDFETSASESNIYPVKFSLLSYLSGVSLQTEHYINIGTMYIFISEYLISGGQLALGVFYSTDGIMFIVKGLSNCIRQIPNVV